MVGWSIDATATAAATAAAATAAPAAAAGGETFEQEMAVGAGSSADVAVPVGGGTVEWRWHLKGDARAGDDLEFSALYIPGAKDGKHVYKASRDAKVSAP